MTIYFAQSGNDPFVKIGHAQTGTVQNRLADLQCGNPQKLQLLGTMSGDMKKERMLHRKFRSAYRQGEWFDLTPEISEFIQVFALPWPRQTEDSVAFDRELGRPAARANGAKHGAPVKFDKAKKREAKRLLAQTEIVTLVKKARGGKVIKKRKPIYSKLEVASMLDISAGTLHAWIRDGKKI